MNNKTGAIVKGGCGCLVAFLVIGLLCVLIGGSMRIDICGAICLFVFGGIIGLIVFAIYNKGVRKGRDRIDDYRDDLWDK